MAPAASAMTPDAERLDMPNDDQMHCADRICAMVFAGGIGLGAYEGGAYAALQGDGGPLPGWVAGSSIGAVTAAIIAGNAPKARVGRLRQFWQAATTDPTPVISFWFGLPAAGPWRQAYNQAAVLETLFLGRPGIFRPRLAPTTRVGVGDVSALYDLAPLRARLTELVDFDRLNDGGVRLSIAATDVVSGERVVFDTGEGVRIEPEHVMASCALLPLFAPIEIDGRLLGDGGLSSNAPLDLVLSQGRRMKFTGSLLSDFYAGAYSMNSSLFSTAAELCSRWRKVKEVGTATVRWIRVVAVFGTGVLIEASPGTDQHIEKA